MVADSGVRATEDWVVERIEFKRGSGNSLSDVRTLTLNGTYQEKITHLGNSLQGFVNLRCLDLSRNALVSLQGLQHLNQLEKLNLYYNNIDDFEELKLLRANKALKDLDVRLNPICRQDSDFRLHLVGVLQGLQRLDDRTVRESEIKAAISQLSLRDSDKYVSIPVPEVESPPDSLSPQISTKKATITMRAPPPQHPPPPPPHAEENDQSSPSKASMGNEEQAILEMIRGLHFQGIKSKRQQNGLVSESNPQQQQQQLQQQLAQQQRNRSSERSQPAPAQESRSQDRSRSRSKSKTT